MPDSLPGPLSGNIIGPEVVFLELQKMTGRYQSSTCASGSVARDGERLGTTSLTTFISFDFMLLLDSMGVDFFHVF